MYITLIKAEIKKFGASEAIMIAYLRQNILYAKQTNTYYHDGKFWLHGTYESIAKDMDMFSIEQTRRLLDKLLKLGVIIKARFNDDPWDKSNWYAFNVESFENGL